MANQTIHSSSNHDEATGRLPGEDFTIVSGSILTIDSMPHLTSRGILGDITITDGTLLIDGTRTFEIVYSGGTGTLPVVGAPISWSGGSGKVIRLNSGSVSSGVFTITKGINTVTPTVTTIITSGTWSTTVQTSSVGFLIVFGEDQDYGATDGLANITITGSWYNIGVGTGADNQILTLPHTGHQHAVWVERSSGSQTFDIWHRISSAASTVWYDTPNEFGNTFESGYVYQQAFGFPGLRFGTAASGGVPPLGSLIRIPNVHMGTTHVTASSTEVNLTGFTNHVAIIPPSVTCNVNISNLNASSVAVNFVQTNTTNVANSAIGLAGTFIDRCAAPVNITNTAFVQPSVNTLGGIAASTVYTVLDQLTGIVFEDCVFYGGIDTAAAQSLWLQTSQNIEFRGRNKIALAITDENTSYPLRLTTTSNIEAEELILLGGGVLATAASNNILIDNFKYGYPPGRGATEANQNGLSLTGVDGWLISSGNLVSGGKFPTIGLALFTDCSDITVRGWGSPTSKVNGGNRLTYICSMAGICSDIKFQRVYFTGLNGAETFLGLNSAKNVLLENCSTDYNDEMEADCNDMIVRGHHVASGVVDAATGFEGDMVNVVGTCFYDHFKSDTTGGIGLLFNPPGVTYSSSVEIVSGTSVFNGTADLLMRTAGDQIIYTWPWSIRGHTAFQNSAIETAGTSTTTNHTFEFSVDSGSGWTPWASADGATLSATPISPAGFNMRVRITAVSSSITNALKGFAILTNTTLADQIANYYPLEVTNVTLSGLIEGTEIRVLTAGTETELTGVESSTTEYTFTVEAGLVVDIVIHHLDYEHVRISNFTIPTSATTIPVEQRFDRNYSNP